MRRIKRELRIFIYSSVCGEVRVLLEDINDRYFPTVVQSEDTTQPNRKAMVEEAVKERFGLNIFDEGKPAKYEIVVQEEKKKGQCEFRAKMYVSEEDYSRIMNSPTCGTVLVITEDMTRKLGENIDSADQLYIEEEIFNII